MNAIQKRDWLDGVDEDDALQLASKVIEMADRVRTMDMACPGAQAKWVFDIDGTTFRATVSVEGAA